MNNNYEVNLCRGFTLIELMIAVVILAILVALAFPSYTRYVDRARRSDAIDVLMQIAAQQERNYSRLANYESSLDASAFGYSLNASGWANTTNDTYQFRVLAPTVACSAVNCYMLEAQPIGAQARDQWQFRLGSNGQRTSRQGTSGAWAAGWPER